MKRFFILSLSVNNGNGVAQLTNKGYICNTENDTESDIYDKLLNNTKNEHNITSENYTTLFYYLGKEEEENDI